MRREFTLPAFDLRYLDTAYPSWESIGEPSGAKWLLLPDWRVHHPGYNVSVVTLALLIPPGYPDAQIDMAYFHPHLARIDGKPIGALALQDIDGKSFQRWSRHRTGEAPWIPGEDDVASHLVLVEDWLERELVKP